MAKTLDEVSKDLYEWQKENPKKRCVLLIARDEDNNIQIEIQGNKVETITCVASAIESIPKVEDLVTEAMNLANRYRREQKTEDN